MPGVIVSHHTLTHSQRRRTYTLVRSRHLRADAALVMVLHGTLQTGDSIREFAAGAFDSLVESGGAIVAYPDAVQREWNGARKATMLACNVKNIDDVGFLGALVDEVSSAWSIDRHQVYAVGFSLGGQMTIRLLHDAPELLAGAALIASNQPAAENLTTSSRPPLAVRVVLIHGTDDPLAPYSGGYVSFRGWFPKGPHLSAAQTAAYFAHRNGITAPPSFHWMNADGTTAGEGQVCRTDYRESGLAPVTLYTVVGGGHQIPGASTGMRWVCGNPVSGFDATGAIADFFDLTPG